MLPENAQTDGVPNPWHHEMQELGFHYRITDIQCALGLSQLKKLEQFVGRRRVLAGRYDAAFEGSAKTLNSLPKIAGILRDKLVPTTPLQALQSRGVDAHAFDPSQRPMEALRSDGFARCFIALHGRFGEDGTRSRAHSS